MEKLKKSNVWAIVGKMTAILTLFWIIVQLYSYFSSNNEYKISTYGRYSKFLIPNDYSKLINDYKAIIALDKAYVENVNEKGLSIEGLKKYLESDNRAELFDLSHEHYKNFMNPVKINEYTYIFNFYIENQGNKPIEDLVLELPFSGYFHINREKGAFSEGSFTKHIDLGVLEPGYSINAHIWSNYPHSFSQYDEEKTRITHKYGWKRIKYPVEVKGIIAWSIRNDNFPFVIFLIIVFTLMALLFILGVEYGPLIRKREKERKLKEVIELEQLRKEAEDNGTDEFNANENRQEKE